MAGTRQNSSPLGETVARLLREEGSYAFDAAVGRLAQGASGALTRVTDRLTDVTENDGRILPARPSGVGGMSAVAALLGLSESSGKGLGAGAGAVKDAAKDLTVGKAKDVKDKVAGAAGGSSGGSGDSSGGGYKPGDTKVTSIIEVLDIGVPLRTVYDYWTLYEDFGDIVKGVQSVSKDDDTTSKWKVKIAFSNRSFEATVQEQVPDDRIVWTSEGSKGSTNGAVSFHELAPSLTRVVVVVEYYPSGFFEKTGNLWRAQGRRLRLDLKHFQRYVTLTQDEPEGWRGEIRDGEVVRSDEEAREAEDDENDENDEKDGDDRDADGEGRSAGRDDDEADDDEYEDEEDDDRDDDEDDEDDEYDDEEDDDGYEDDEDGEYEDEDAEDEKAGAAR
ncbi:SRPBCC family protein [Streptomyces fuscigenes]|uniref:SRPBCC family protein n=1 Tax=Streptomyces fuscigenes TaxID=1528880 RepID=UPI001F15989E|nr:SRPBCC family protein [Streptomyces fuscigenes]MCF3962120.1 SRPBCC family protein [Streptomyces fuscigenes]